jgi:hypothetical protein
MLARSSQMSAEALCNNDLHADALESALDGINETSEGADNVMNCRATVVNGWFTELQVIRGLAIGMIDNSYEAMRDMIKQQAQVGVILGSALGLGGFVRVYITSHDLVNAVAISAALVAIVMTSVILGCALPFALSKAGVDPAHGGTSIAVVMDVAGVAITCLTCDFIFRTLASSLS